MICGVVFTSLFRILLLLQVAQNPTTAAPPTTAPAGATTTVAIPTSQPTTQPLQLTVNVPAAPAPQTPETIVDAFSNTTLNQIIQGKKKLELKDILDIRFWVGTIN